METKVRNEGIDLLRIVAMFFVMILLTLGQGGLLGSFAGNYVNMRAVWALNIIALPAVNIFAMISGYVGYTETPKPFRVSKYFSLWLMVFTYGLILTIVQAIVTEGGVSGSDVAASFFPVTSNHFWYFTAYTGLFLLMPVINAMIRMYSPERLKKILLVVLIVFSAYDFWTDRFIPGYTLTMMWLAVMYFIGAVIKKCDIGANLRSRHLAIIIALCTFFTWIWKLTIPEFNILGITVSGDTVTKNSAPAVVISAMAYLILFSRIRFKKGKDTQKFVRFCAPAVFASYIVSCHPLIWFNILSGRFSYLCQRNSFEMIGTVLIFSALLMGAAILVEQGRLTLFKLIKVKQGLEWAEDKLRAAVFKHEKQ